VSSDSDFTRLAARIRESGRRVYGFGEMKTSRPFVSACDRFIYTEVFAKKPEDQQESSLVPRNIKELRGNTALLNLLRSAIEACSDEVGWAQLGPVGNFISKTANDFDPRNYGFAKLSELITAIGLFDIERRETRVFVRDNRKKAVA
jgi:uncharacterized LabA/DUF88 family protein